MQKEADKKIWGFIYAYAINGRGNVGQTIDLKGRFKRHFREKITNSHFHNSLRKYWCPGYFRIIEAFYNTKKNLEKILNEREMFWIAELDTYDPKQEKGWNLTKGGGGKLGHIPTKETREKISKFSKGENNPMFGKFGREHPKFGKFCSEESRKRISESKKGENNPMFGTISPNRGKHPSEITRKRMSASQKGLQAGENHPMARKILLISPIGKQYELFGTCFQFCKNNNLNYGHIFEMLKGQRSHHKKWTGKYLD